MKEVLKQFFRYYLEERNLEAALSLLTETVIAVGIREGETVQGKAEVRKWLFYKFAELPHSLYYEIDEDTEMTSEEFVRNLLAKFKMRWETVSGTREVQTRLTATFVPESGVWKIAVLHLSMPMSQKDIEWNTKMERNTHWKEWILEMLPGGTVGMYLEEGLPLYHIDQRMLEILGYTYEELLEVTGENMINMIHYDDRLRVIEEMREQLRHKKEYALEYRVFTKQKQIIWLNVIGKRFFVENGREVVMNIMTDISDRVEWELQLREEAEKDSLTKLHNRKAAMKLIAEALQQQEGGWFFMCDVDNFKRVNDAEGHIVGDRVLVQLATIMREQVGQAGIIARWGGDEYGLFFPAVVKQADALQMVQTVQQEFLNYMTKTAPELRVSLSVGGTISEEDDTIATLYIKADRALYQAKQKKGELILL